LKIFQLNYQTSHSFSTENFSVAFFLVFSAFFSLLFVILWMTYFRNEGDQLIDSTPHLTTVTSSYYYGLLVLSNLFEILTINMNYYLRHSNPNFSVE
jgi:hypothetical protein